MRTAFMARPSRASISPSPIGAGEQRGRHFKAERTPDWLDRPWEDEQQVRMRLRPPEINVSVNYARLSINTVQLANALKLRRPGVWDRCTAGFQSPLRPLWVIRVRSARSERSRDVRFAPKADMHTLASKCLLLCQERTYATQQND